MRFLAAAVALTLAAPIAASNKFDALFQKHGAAYGVDWKLLKAVAQVESNLDPRAENRRDPSIGIMQVFCRPAGNTCANALDALAWPPPHRDRLLDPDYNIQIGAQILAANIRSFGLRKGIATYNQWGARTTHKGRPFPNQRYVDKVMRAYRMMAKP